MTCCYLVKRSPEELKIGDRIKVFIYHDKQGRKIASRREAKITLNQFASLKVKNLTSVGAFMDWGLDKDLLVPYQEQAEAMREGQFYMVYLYLDPKTERLVASSRINSYLDNENLTVDEGDEVALMIWEMTDLGYNVIINQKHKGLLYQNEIFTHIKTGAHHKGYIYKIREDNKIDVRLQKTGYQIVEPSAKKILDILHDLGGFLPLHDKSDPEDIRDRLQMSKKTFKKAVGHLYKEQIIYLTAKGIYLIDEEGEEIIEE